jgi:two-component system, sensor histidine kinase and response regulator
VAAKSEVTIISPRPERGEPNAAAATPEAQLQESIQPLTILLAEDNVLNQKLTVRLLEGLGHQVVVANNGYQALERLKTQSFDLVLMDVEMPEMNGCAATTAIRAQEENTPLHIPIIAMTAHDLSGDRERCLEVGMDDFLAKPIDATKLNIAIRRTMKDRSAASLQALSSAAVLPV